MFTKQKSIFNNFFFFTFSDGITTDKQTVYVSAFNELELPEVGSKIKLQITNVVSVNTFYGCIINSQSESKSLR